MQAGLPPENITNLAIISKTEEKRIKLM